MSLSNKNSKIIVNHNNKPSDFMIDLASIARKEEDIFLEKEKNVNFLNKGQNKIKKVFKKNKRQAKKENVKNTFFKNKQNFSFDDTKYDIAVEDDFKVEDESTEKLINNYTEERIAIDDLAFFQTIKTSYFILKQLIKMFKTLCFRSGWFVVFLLRFVYFLIIRILKEVYSFVFLPFAKIFNIKKKSIHEENYIHVEDLLPQNIMDPVLLEERAGVSSARLEQKSFSDFVEQPLATRNFKTNNPPVQKMYSHNKDNYADLKQDFFGNNLSKKRVFPSFSFRFYFSHLKTTMYFAVFMLVLILPFKAFTYYSVLQDLGGRVLGVSENAIGDFKNAGTAVNNLDFYKAGEQFAEASDGFLQAQDEINDISDQLQIFASIVPSQKLAMAADAQYILEAGEISSRIGQQISFILDAFNYKKDKSIKTIFNVFFDNIGPIQKKIAELYEVLQKIDAKNLPTDKQESFEFLRDKTGQIKDSFTELVDLLNKMKIFLGFNGEKRYLLIFQNNSEMRASGGFMGSFAIVDFRNGEIVNLEIPEGGTYDTEGAFLDHIVAPEPLHIVNPSWHFWDANWWPDWKKTSRKLEWFYENSGGSSVDGVIGITPVVAERLLKIMGPLDMLDTHGVVINSENFWEITQTFAEQKPINHPAYEPLPFKAEDSNLEESQTETQIDPGLKPKKIIGDLIGKIETELPNRLNKDMFFKLIASLEQSLLEKHLLFYADDYVLQDKFEELSWAGRTKKTAWDYLMVVNSNISGAKSDRKIKQEINHQSEVLEDGSIVDTLRIKRTHTGVKGERFTGVKNLDWMRIYLPLGSQFIEAKGFWPPDESLFEKPDPSWRHDEDLKNSEENFIRDSSSWTKIYNEGDKTVFANWVQVNPGESVEIVVRYILPFRLNLDNNDKHPFALLVEKQPGAMSGSISSHLILPESAHVEWQYPEDIEIQTDGWFIEDQLASDKFWAVLIK